MSTYAIKDHILRVLDNLGRFLRFENPDKSVVPMCAVLYQSGTAVSLTGTTNETTLATVTIPAGMLGGSGQIIVTATWSHTNNANVKTKRMKYGTFDFAGAHQEASTASSRDRFAMIQRTTASQIAYANSNFGGGTAALLTGAIDSTVDQTLTITGQLAVGTDTLTMEALLVEVIAS